MEQLEKIIGCFNLLGKLVIVFLFFTIISFFYHLFKNDREFRTKTKPKITLEIKSDLNKSDTTWVYKF